MPASFQVLNGSTWQWLGRHKGRGIVVLARSSGDTKQFPHEFESPNGEDLTWDMIKEQANALLLAYENSDEFQPPQGSFAFGEPQPLVIPEGENP